MNPTDWRGHLYRRRPSNLEMEDAEARVLRAGASPPLDYMGSGAQGIVFCGTEGHAWKAARGASDPRWAESRRASLRDEHDWLRAAGRHLGTRMIPRVYALHETEAVLERDCARGEPPGWNTGWENWHSELDVPGWGAPEPGRDQWIVTRDGPVMIDGGYAIRRGEVLARHVEAILSGEIPAYGERLRDMAWSVYVDTQQGRIPFQRGAGLLREIRAAGDDSEFSSEANIARLPRPNPDAPDRELERRATSGDVDAARELVRHLARSRQPERIYDAMLLLPEDEQQWAANQYWSARGIHDPHWWYAVPPNWSGSEGFAIFAATSEEALRRAVERGAHKASTVMWMAPDSVKHFKSENVIRSNPPRARRTLAKVRKAVGRERECYPAAEVVYHAGGGKLAGLTPVQQRHQGRSHWWVRGPKGKILDAASAQFSRPVPYGRGKGKGFLTKRPSRRARALARRAGVKLNPPGDRGRREFERRVASGDTDAVAPLVSALRRAGEPVPMGLLARFFALHHPGDHLVTYPSGKQRKVKNLGWLRRQLHSRGGSLTGNLIPLRFVVRTDVAPFPGECYLRVELSDGLMTGLPAPNDFAHTHTFETMFASCHHLWDWLQTPLFQNEPLDWDGRIGAIGLRMHGSTYGHPSGSEGGPDAVCHRCLRAFRDDRLPPDPDYPQEDRGVATCPTCFALRNPDERGRQDERLAAAGDLEASARAIVHKVRSGEIPMANVELAAGWTGRRDARMVFQFDDLRLQYLEANRRDLVRWARRLDSMLPGSVTRRVRYRDLDDRMVAWLRGGKLPPAWPGGGWSVYTNAFHMARARSVRRLHELVKSTIETYRVAVWQRFQDELAGHHGDERLSPAWSTDWYQLRGEPAVWTPTGEPAVTVTQEAGREVVNYSPLAVRIAAERQATDLLGRILLHEE